MSVLSGIGAEVEWLGDCVKFVMEARQLLGLNPSARRFFT